MSSTIKTLKLDKKAWVFLVILEILLISFFCFLHCRKEPVELNFTQDDLFYDSGEKGFYLDMSSDSQLIKSPEFALSPGLYTAEIEYMRSSDSVTFLEICYSDERHDAAVSGRISLRGENCASCDFRVKYDERPMYLRGGLTKI